MESKENESVQGNDTTEPSELKEFANFINQRRNELGIKPDAVPAQITPAMPARELTSEQVVEREAEQQRMALAEQRSRREGMYAVLCDKVGGRYTKCRFQNFAATTDRQKAALDACREYADTLIERIADANGLVLYGPVGTGKDHLAFAISGTAIVRHGKSAGWLNGQDWFGEIRDQMTDDGMSERSLIQRLVAPDLLTISDPLPPVGLLSQHQSTMLYRLIDARYHSGKPTIVTVNVKDDEEADNRIGVPTWDRICDGAWKVHCNWQSYRKPARIVNGKA